MARAWRKGDDATLSELTLADPTPGEGRVLVEVEGAAIDPFAATPRGRVPGVAAVGRVRAVGAAAGEWQDARVLVPMLAPCGECDRCRRGGVALCPDGAAHGVDGPGTLATTIAAAARWLVRLEAPLALPGRPPPRSAASWRWPTPLRPRRRRAARADDRPGPGRDRARAAAILDAAGRRARRH
ncbi:MAG: alcohol dehydrogenase catalytic domain-containing protein [Kofleriaceae bacterium]|nr:alcohol dehydrogenase catalytic domain-containing protein [Kofleriaceae bacterium]